MIVKGMVIRAPVRDKDGFRVMPMRQAEFTEKQIEEYEKDGRVQRIESAEIGSSAKADTNKADAASAVDGERAALGGASREANKAKSKSRL